VNSSTFNNTYRIVYTSMFLHVTSYTDHVIHAKLLWTEDFKDFVKKSFEAGASSCTKQFIVDWKGYRLNFEFPHVGYKRCHG
jgi:hypothetical protein